MQGLRLLGMPFLVALLACQESTQAPVVDVPTPQTDGAVVYLVVSPAHPRAGDTVVVTVLNRSGTRVGAVGSFSVRLGYDPAQSRFADAVPLSGGLRVHNPAQPGLVRVAGAAAGGFGSDTLFVGRFVASGAEAASGFRVEVSELTGATAFRDLLPVLRVQRAAVLRDAPAVVRVGP